MTTKQESPTKAAKEYSDLININQDAKFAYFQTSDSAFDFWKRFKAQGWDSDFDRDGEAKRKAAEKKAGAIRMLRMIPKTNKFKLAGRRLNGQFRQNKESKYAGAMLA